jgi:hypothetical protein
MPLNVNVADGNFSLGPLSGFFYSVSSSLDSLIQLEADGDVVDTFPVFRSQLRNPVSELHYDGTFFWTLEDLPSDLGLVIKRWRVLPVPNAQGLPPGTLPPVSPTDFTWQDEITLINGPTIRWSSKAFCVEHYHRVLDGSFQQGATVIRLNDVTNISPGDLLYLGPSDFGGFEDHEEEIIVSSVNELTNDIGVGNAGGLKNSYVSDDPVDFVKSIFLFNDHSFSGIEDRRGALVRFSWPGKQILNVDGGMKYYNAGAADFDVTSLFWVRSQQIMEINLANPTFDIASSNESNLIEDNKTDVIEVYDMITDLANTQHLKLQQQETNEDVGTGNLTTTDWSPRYNFQSQPTLPVINSINMSMDTRFSVPLPSADVINIAAEVRDQFNLPVFNETVQFSAAINTFSDPGIPGTFSPTNAVTNTSGIAETVYTPSVTPEPIIVDITAEVL